MTAAVAERNGSPLGLLLNLECEDGHRHYSPTPLAFDGGLCTASTNPGSCRRALRLSQPLELPRNSGEVAGVNGLTTLEGGSAASA